MEEEEEEVAVEEEDSLPVGAQVPGDQTPGFRSLLELILK